MIAIIDYDMGNLKSVAKAFEKVGARARVTRDAKVIMDASHVVLPGVGAFRDCIKHLDEFNLISPILKSVKEGKPFLGICLGMQLLFDESMEFGRHQGLGLIKGSVVRFPAATDSSGLELKVPHMGWNDIKMSKGSALMKGIHDGAYFYFVHSYYTAPADASVTLTTTSYGLEFTSAIEKDNIMACQFHPEKSQRVGLKLLKNFSELV